MVFRFTLFLGALFPLIGFLGCHPLVRTNAGPWDSLARDTQRESLVASADELGRIRRYRVDGRSFSFDCSGFVGAVLFRNGIDVFGGASELDMRGNGVRLLREFVARYGTLFRENPRPGDLVFFSRTYDRDRDRRNDDEFTHVGIVERVAADGTVTFLHHLRRHVTRDVMNLSQPDMHKIAGGNILNSYLRRRRRSDSPETHYLSGTLFAGFGSLVSDRPEPEPAAPTQN